MARSCASSIAGLRYWGIRSHHGACLTHRFDPARPRRDGLRAVAGRGLRRLRRSLVGEPTGAIAIRRDAASPAPPSAPQVAPPAPRRSRGPPSQRPCRRTCRSLPSAADAASRSPPPQTQPRLTQSRLAVTAKDTDKTGAVAPQATTKRYYRVTVRDGGTLQSGSVVIKLAGIAARDDEATCKGTRTARHGPAALPPRRR